MSRDLCSVAGFHVDGCPVPGFYVVFFVSMDFVSGYPFHILIIYYKVFAMKFQFSNNSLELNELLHYPWILFSTQDVQFMIFTYPTSN